MGGGRRRSRRRSCSHSVHGTGPNADANEEVAQGEEPVGGGREEGIRRALHTHTHTHTHTKNFKRNGGEGSPTRRFFFFFSFFFFWRSFSLPSAAGLVIQTQWVTEFCTEFVLFCPFVSPSTLAPSLASVVTFARSSYRVLPSFTGFYRVLLGLTEFDWV